jgi:hypothetical protein
LIGLLAFVVNQPAAGSSTADMEPFDDGMRQSAP